MRASVIHILVALLIAVFAIGSPPPAQAACAECQDCSTEAPAKNDVPCPEKGLACQVAQACASQVQKAPVQINVCDLGVGDRDAFGFSSSIAIKSAYLTPETAPPRV
jgi:hypothetical protein